MNQLYYGDNLHVLRELLQHRYDGFVDLVYLDPPFNSNRNYSVLFANKSGEKSDAQIEAFEDTWQWGPQAEAEFRELLHQENTDVAEMMEALRSFLGENEMMAYLVMMANRLLLLHKALKPTGSLYLHCDPTASHYLKIVLDGVFGAVNFLSEVVWKRTSSHSSSKRWGPIHDVILLYAKSEEFTWNKVYQPYDESYIDQFYRYKDENGKYTVGDLTGSGTRKGDSGKPWKGINPTAKGRHWAVPVNIIKDAAPEKNLDSLSTQEKLDILDSIGLVHWPERGTMPRLKRYLRDDKGTVIQDIIVDISPVQPHAREKLGYPTQKPLALLERIIQASSNEGDIVMDPFCGCGTAVHAAQKLGRQWIGIDITHLAISLIEKRLNDAFPGIEYEVHGTPKDLGGARDLFQRDPFQFEWWACSLVNAQPYGGKKRGADSGIDGLIYFEDEKNKVKKIIVQVKGGNVGVKYIRELISVVDREKAAIGLFISLNEPTKPMITEALKAGYYESPHFAPVEKIQILSIEGLMDKTHMPHYPDMSGGSHTFRRAVKEKRKGGKQEELGV